MAYPRELNLDKDTEERLINYIEDELSRHYAERGPHIDDILRYQKDYWAKPQTEKATFPFQGAATIIIPLTAIAVEAVHARTMTTMFGQAQLVTAHALAPEVEPLTHAVEKYMDRELLDNMKVRRSFGDCFLEAEKFGTMIGKTGYEKLVKYAIRQVGDQEQKFPVVIKDGATFDCVPDARFLMPYGPYNPQTAPWCGEEHTASWYEVELMERSGLFKPGTILDQLDESTGGVVPADTQASNMRQSKLKAYFSNTNGGTVGNEGGNQFDNNQDQLQNVVPTMPSTLNWVELWLAFDVDGDKENEEIIVHYHRGARTLMSARHNWHSDVSRPYDTGVYFPLEHRWRGFGICKKNEQFQREITTQHRQRLDNATLANMRMIVINKMSGYGPGEPVFPGKQWFVDDKDHITTLQLGEIYPSAYNNEQSTLIYSQQRTGIGELQLGMQPVGTPGTATSDLARIQEGRAKSDFVYQNFREFVDSVIPRIAANIQQFGPRQLTYYDTAENGQLVAQYFSLPEGLIRDQLLIKLKVSSQQFNKVLDRQNWQQVAAFLQQYYGNLIQLAETVGDPNLLMLVFQRALSASTEAMSQILETFDIRNIKRLIVPELQNIGGQQSGTQLAGGNAGRGNQAVTSGISPASTMDLFAAAIQGTGQNGNGIPNRIPNSGGGV